MRFAYTQKRESNSFAQRSVAMVRRVMVASSQQLATQTGLKVLSKGEKSVKISLPFLDKPADFYQLKI